MPNGPMRMLLVATLLVAVQPAAWAADRPSRIADPASLASVSSYAPDGTSVYYDVDPGCTGGAANTGPVQVRRIGILGAPPPPLDLFSSDPARAPGQCNPSRFLSTIAVDGSHVWFVDGVGFLSRLPKSATPGTPIDAEYVTSMSPGDLTAELVAAPDALYLLQPGNVSSITRFAPGSPVGVPVATGGPAARDLQFDGTDLFWNDGGDLKRWTPGQIGVATLASGVSTYFAEGFRIVGCGTFGCVFSRNVYVGTFTGQVFLRGNAGSGAPALVHQSPALGASIADVTTDATRLFVIERRPNDDPLVPFPRFVVLRGDRTTLAAPATLYASDFNAYDPAVGLDSLQTSGGQVTWRSVDFTGGRNRGRIYRLSADAEAIAERDLEVTGIEVTQAIQDLANRVPLIQRRKTFARVHVRANGAAVCGVSAVLRGFAGGQPLGTLYPVNRAGYRLCVPASPNRTVVDDAFLFELPWSWTDAPNAPPGTGLVLEAELNPNRFPPEPSYANNGVQVGPLGFVPSPRFRLLVNRMLYRWNGVDTVPSAGQVKPILDFYRQVYPLASLETLISGTGPGFLVSEQVVRDDGLLARVDGTSPECRDNLCAADYLNARRDVYGFQGGGLGDDVYVFQLVNDAPAFTRGRAPFGGRVGTGGVSQYFIGAHETAHNLDRYHPVRASGPGTTPPSPPDTMRCGHSGDDAGLPYADTLLDASPLDPAQDVLGFDVLGRGVLARTAADMIGYCNPGNQWVSDYTWNALRAEMAATQGSSAPGDGASGAPAIPGDWLVFSGVATPSLGRGRLLEVQRATELTRVWADDAGPFRLRQRAGSGALLAERPFAGQPASDGELPQTTFTGAVAFAPGARTIELVDTRSGRVLDARSVPATPPSVDSVALVAPPSPLSGPLTLAWSATSPAGAPLRFDVLAAPDGGPLAPLVQGAGATTATFDGDALPGASVRFRVVAHDGVNTAFADSPAYAVAPRPPAARILSPEAPQAVPYGQVLNLSGVGEDPEGGAVQLAWSTATRALGAGPQISLDDLEPGAHVVTLTATDAQGLVGTASVPVSVVYDDAAPSAPFLSVGPARLGWSVSSPADPAPSGAIEVRNAGPGALAFSVGGGAPWLVLGAAGGVAPASVSITALPFALLPGEARTAVVTITELGGAGRTVDVPVALAIGNAIAGGGSGDSDGDGVLDGVDLCPAVRDPGQDDADADAVGDACDNCPFAANAAQADRGGLGGATPDGIGDACQCGDVTGDGRITLADAAAVSRSLLTPPAATLLRPERCDVGGSAGPGAQGCTLTDAVILRRALLTPPAAQISEQCGPAIP